MVKNDSEFKPIERIQFVELVVSLSLRLLIANCLCVNMSLGFFLFCIKLFSNDLIKGC